MMVREALSLHAAREDDEDIICNTMAMNMHFSCEACVFFSQILRTVNNCVDIFNQLKPYVDS